MSVRVIHGINAGQFDVVGQTVGKVADALGDAFNLPPDASALVNGQFVSGNHHLASGDHLEFIPTLGRKGGVPDYWAIEEVIEWFGEETVRKMEEVGMKPVMKPVVPKDQIMTWFYKTIGEQDIPFRHIRVDIDNETIICHGKPRHIERDLAAVAKSLLNGKGATRTGQQILEEFPRYIHDQRIDLLVKQLKRDYRSEIGYHIRSKAGKGYWLEAPE